MLQSTGNEKDFQKRTAQRASLTDCMYFLVLQGEAGEYTVAGCNDNADPVLEARARGAVLVAVKATKGAALNLADLARREGWGNRRTPWPTASLACDV